MTKDQTFSMNDLLHIMEKLRDKENGCPWDVEQTFETIAPYTIEEAYEVDDAIRAGDMNSLQGELGDLLLQVVFHARMAEEAGHFNFADVVQGVSAKMVKRHPHVFGDATIEDADAQTKAWEEQKAQERAELAKQEGRTPSVLDDLSLGLPALLRSYKLQKRVARVGFDWENNADVVEKISEECAELLEAQDKGTDQDHIEEEFGDLLFAMTNLARRMKIEPEEALRKANAKFERRFRGIEAKLEANGSSPTQSNLQEMDKLWDEVKQDEKQARS